MASAVTEVAAGLLILICIAEGTLSLNIEHKESVNAIAGQNISLPCFVSLEHETSIVQMQWNKNVEQQVQNLVVYSAIQATHYNVKDWRLKFQLVNKTNTSKPYGSVLHLNDVSENDTGTYVCEVASFPHGFFKRETKVFVKAPQLYLKVNSPKGALIEGDEVNVTCSSDPPADVYRLRSSKNDLSWEDRSGDFTIHGITRHIKDLICQPLWNSSAPHLQSLRANVSLTVDFLDSIECSSESRIEMEAGTNLTIACWTKSSLPISYLWKKENNTVSHNANLSLWSVNSNDSSLYSLTVHTATSTRLQKQRDFIVIVLNRTHTAKEHLASTVPMETSQISISTVRTTGPTATTVTTDGLYVNPTTPSAGNSTTLHANTTTPNASPETSATALSEKSTRSESCCEMQNTTSGPGTDSKNFTSISPLSTFSPASILKTTVRTNKNITESNTVKEPSSSKTAVYVLLPLALVLVLIAVLYRRYLIQKRMDLPPPFKPPPPPVKYTSVRREDDVYKLAVTDVLV